MKRIVRRKPLSIPLMFGCNWFSLHKSVVKYILDYLDKHPEYLDRFKWTTCCDELFFQTMLAPVTETLHINTKTNLRYLDWNIEKKKDSTGKVNSPLLLTNDDYDKIISSGAVFCRKVHPAESEKLIKLLLNPNHIAYKI